MSEIKEEFGKNVKHHNQIKKWIITFPQSEGIVDKKTFADGICKEWPATKFISVEENHKGVGKHLHLVIEFRSGVSKIQLCNYGTRIYPGNDKRIDYRSAGSWDTSIDYLTKPGYYNGHNKTDVDPEPYVCGIKIDGDKRVSKKQHDNWMEKFGYESERGCPTKWGPCAICDKTSIIRPTPEMGKKARENLEWFWEKFADAMKINDTEEE